ncbi:lysophospholipid acyltransferase family protein [Undibacterium terreum]|uniref:Acyltransferase n=1 Tax=Undibacterium terreum TaxID=1224302 RepID=A0A916XJI5_9BURK|nr:lysophospholipid acyltransferase family protein [Undibacterium terreum]GGC74998.1 acyltransferase [Undibacterium terreum]
MHHTIFDTPVINSLMFLFSTGMLRLLGWKIDGRAPAESKYVMIAAPHTSNWDFPYTLMAAFAMRLNLYWMGKDTLFPPVLGSVMRWLGGIAVNRRQSGNMVQGTVDAFHNAQQLAVVVPPEGTRGKVTHWKTGFYYIAVGANVPIALGYLDFKRKVGGIGKMFYPTGNLEADMAEIQKFYAGISGKNPHQFSSEHIQVKGD